MSLAEYFENTEGIGVLATADSQGHVDLALYARPHVLSEEEVAFVMGDRLSHANVCVNPHAAYLFLEQGGSQGRDGYNGLRLYLTRLKEEIDPDKIEEIRRAGRKGRDYGDQKKYLVHFKVEGPRRLVGD